MKKLKHFSQGDWLRYLKDPVLQNKVNLFYNIGYDEWRDMFTIYPNFLEAATRYWMDRNNLE